MPAGERAANNPTRYYDQRSMQRRRLSATMVAMRAQKAMVRGAQPVSVWRLVARFALIGLAALAGVAVVTSRGGRQLGRREAIRDARRVA